MTKPRFGRILGLLVALALAVGACGGESNSGDSGGEAPTGAEQTSTSAGGAPATRKPGAGGCPLVTGPPDSGEEPRARTVGAPFEVELSTGSNSAAAEVTVTAVRAPRRIPRYQDKGTFAPKGGRFLAVVFRFRNVGAGDIEAANTVGELFAVTGRPPTKRYLRADGSAGCGAISASFARSIGAMSPEEDLKPGEAYKTAAVYVVPEDEGDFHWVAPESGDLVRLPAVPPAG